MTDPPDDERDRGDSVHDRSDWDGGEGGRDVVRARGGLERGPGAPRPFGRADLFRFTPFVSSQRSRSRHSASVDQMLHLLAQDPAKTEKVALATESLFICNTNGSDPNP